MAKRINKTTASNAALKITEEYYGPLIEHAKNQLKEYCNKIVVENIPPSVLAIAKEYPEYFYMCRCVYVTTEKCSEHYVYSAVGFSVPTNRTCQAPILEVTASQYNEARRLKNAVMELEEARNKRGWEIRDTLISLGTRKKIEEAFPDIVGYIEWGEEKQLPAVQYDGISQILKSLKHGKNCSN